MIRNVTNNWQQPPAGNGLYVLRGRNEPYRGVVRVGVAGIGGAQNGLFQRLGRHLSQRTGPQTCGTHECNPFELIYAWELDNWLPVDLASAEHCLYRALAVNFPRRTEGLPDNSLFLVPESCDLKQALKNVGNDLLAIESLRPADVPPCSRSVTLRQFTRQGARPARSTWPPRSAARIRN